MSTCKLMVMYQVGDNVEQTKIMLINIQSKKLLEEFAGVGNGDDISQEVLLNTEMLTSITIGKETKSVQALCR